MCVLCLCCFWLLLLLCLAGCKKGFHSIALQMSPLFWIAFILRIKCLTSFFEGHLCKTFMSINDDDDENEEEKDGAAYQQRHSTNQQDWNHSSQTDHNLVRDFYIFFSSKHSFIFFFFSSFICSITLSLSLSLSLSPSSLHLPVCLFTNGMIRNQK